MTGTNTDGIQQMVRAMGEALYNEPGEKPMPAASTDADEVIREQLTENTGTHFLDSGSAYGRHWEENQENPPWEQAAWTVNDGWVTHNLYHFMADTFGRDETCVALEVALYAFAYSDDRKRDAWLTCQEDFAEALLAGHFTRPMLTSLGVPEDAAEMVLGVQAEYSQDAGPFAAHDASGPALTHNTYNGHETHTLSQILQGTNLGGPYSEYVFLQVHNGCDVRGGYTAPRVYSVFDSWIPGELWFSCHECEWDEAESCLYNTDHLLYQPEPDPQELFEALRERSPEHVTDDEIRDRVDEQIDAGHDSDHQDGAVYHLDNGCGGTVGFM